MMQVGRSFCYVFKKDPCACGRYRETSSGQRLGGARALLGNDMLTLHEAGILTIGWISSYAWAGLSLDSFPNLKAWLDRISARPAVMLGSSVPKSNYVKPEDAEKAAKEASDRVGFFSSLLSFSTAEFILTSDPKRDGTKGSNDLLAKICQQNH